MFVILTCLVVLSIAALGFVQAGSDAILSSAGTPGSLPSRLSPAFGRAIYDRIERIAPAPYVEAMLAEAALRRGDLARAQHHAAMLPPSVQRADLLGRIAQARGDDAFAQREYLQADDIFAIGAEVKRLAAHDAAAAYDLELRFKARLQQLRTHPDAVAEAYWRLGQLATLQEPPLGPLREYWLRVGMRDYRQAVALAPFAEKYLLAAGSQALNLHRFGAAHRYYRRAAGVDPASADAYAGMGLAALATGHRAAALAYARRSRSFDPHAHILHTLEAQLR